MRGYPSRIDTVVSGLDLADPRAGWSWHADEFQILQLAYRPHHVAAGAREVIALLESLGAFSRAV